MLVTCSECGQSYDDADRLTYCPHNLIMPPEDLARKKIAIQLLEKRVRFAHMPVGSQSIRVQGCTWNGMILLEGWSGEFAPHIFVVVEEE